MSSLNDPSKQKKSISITQSILINKAPERVFDYMSNLANDSHWRPEVERMDVKTNNEEGSEIVEYLRIYRFFTVVTPVIVKRSERPMRFIVETPISHSSWVHCIRSIDRINNNACHLTVQLSFSLDNIKQMLPFIPPAWTVRLWYAPRIKNYLKNLKRILESSPES